jgi:hypothetical protein
MPGPLAATQQVERALVAVVAGSPQARVNGGLEVPVQAAAVSAVVEAAQCRCVEVGGAHQ